MTMLGIFSLIQYKRMTMQENAAIYGFINLKH